MADRLQGAPSKQTYARTEAAVLCTCPSQPAPSPWLAFRMHSMTRPPYKQWFSTRGHSANQGTPDEVWRHIWLSHLGAFTDIWWIEAKTASELPTAHGTAPHPATKNLLAPHVRGLRLRNSAESQ